MFTSFRRIVMALSALAACACAMNAQQPRIRLATLAPKGTSFERLLLEMGEQWNKAPEGGATLTVYADGTMGSEQQVIRRMRVGQLQAGMLTSDGLAMIDPSVKALQEIPLMYHSIAEDDYVRSHMIGEIENRMEDHGFVVIAWSVAGFARPFSKQPALHPQDFLRMKTYVGADDLQAIQIYNSIGGHPVGLDWTNTLTALQTGMVESLTTLPVHALGAQFNTALSNMLDLKWVPVSGGIVVTRKSWDALPASTRAAMKKAAEAALTQMESASLSEEAASIQALQKHGMVIHPMTPELQREWDQFAENVLWPKVRGQIVSAESFDKVRSLVLEYRKQSGERQ
jgi:TRAP-type C4-dicarboxylate transport system substrate-binding protein